MYKVSNGRKVFKVIMNILLFPILVASKVAWAAFYVIGTVAGFGIVRTAAWISLGLVLLGSLVGAGWGTFFILGIPLGFLLALPYISGFLISCCDLVSDKIIDYWGTPAGAAYYDLTENMELEDCMNEEKQL